VFSHTQEVAFVVVHCEFPMKGANKILKASRAIFFMLDDNMCLNYFYSANYEFRNESLRKEDKLRQRACFEGKR